MFQRNISQDDVERVINHGEVIESYPEDGPYPGKLLFGFIGRRPLHVVIADNLSDQEMIVITAYEPDEEKWQKDFMRRK